LGADLEATMADLMGTYDVYAETFAPTSSHECLVFFLGGRPGAQDGYVMTSVEHTAHTSYFDGKLLSARDLSGEQIGSFDAGYDLFL
jgi:hypothetical protein